ncbi:condensin-2 complex subunit H2 isoform X1 [Phalacrocorax aristotelis]|uniref:condensin-2 complex subunit H2 isoform X1 n=1 Tax=Phalacrocorax aristotelis TaxID=126867 RepID=UPI003F4B69BF
MEEVESRFVHLLQPIRDLTKNWEVDVASQLGEYLEELDQICISFDNGKTTMNFAEAALLIQGSACIYSRKVEYLYSLVYQTLDLISNKKREKQPSSVGPDGKDADATFGAEEKEEFLSLDDIEDSSQASVDMKKEHQPNAVNIVPLTPMSLVPLEEAEKRDNPLFSRKGEMLGSRKDFRMNTCTPHATGAFLLELAGLSPTCLQQRQCERSPSRAAAGVPSCVLGSPRESVSIGGAPIQALSFSEDGGPDDDNSRGDDVEMAPVANEHIEAQRNAPRPKGYMLRERAPAEEPKAHIKEMLDPWQSLDPFGDSEDKPFKKGRPFLVPHGLDDVVGGKRKRKGSRKLQDFMKWFSAAYNNVPDSRKPKRKGPTFADLEVLYWKQLKKRMAVQRKLQGQAGPLWRLPAPLPCEEELDLLEEERGADCYEGAVDDFVEHEDIQPEVQEELGERATDPHDLDSLGYEELVRRNVELFIANSQKYMQETALSQHIRRWEEQMGPLLQEQEERAPFDIHSYGDMLVSSCGRLGEWHSFASLVAGQPPFEVCRYMLASLQLANDYMVELAQSPGLDTGLDTARLRLLTHERAQDRFRAFQLPSACSSAGETSQVSPSPAPQNPEN